MHPTPRWEQDGTPRPTHARTAAIVDNQRGATLLRRLRTRHVSVRGRGAGSKGCENFSTSPTLTNESLPHTARTRHEQRATAHMQAQTNNTATYVQRMESKRMEVSKQEGEAELCCEEMLGCGVCLARVESTARRNFRFGNLSFSTEMDTHYYAKSPRQIITITPHGPVGSFHRLRGEAVQVSAVHCCARWSQRWLSQPLAMQAKFS